MTMLMTMTMFIMMTTNLHKTEQMKHLEEKNAAHLEKTQQLEEELRKTNSLKTQLETYKRQVQELQLKFAEEIKRGDRAEFEKERNAEKLSLVEAERISLQSEREALKETVAVADYQAKNYGVSREHARSIMK